MGSFGSKKKRVEPEPGPSCPPPPPLKPKNRTTTVPTTPPLIRMKALYDFEKMDHTEVDFQVDDILLVEEAERGKAEEWMRARHERTNLEGKTRKDESRR